MVELLVHHGYHILMSDSCLHSMEISLQPSQQQTQRESTNSGAPQSAKTADETLLGLVTHRAVQSLQPFKNLWVGIIGWMSPI